MQSSMARPLRDTGTISADQASAIVTIGLAVTTANTTNDVRQMAKQQYPGMLLGLRGGIFSVGFDSHLYFGTWLQADLLTILVN